MRDVLRVMRERFRASSGSTVAAFEALARQLAATPDAPEVVQALRRELHRVRGTAGTFGFDEASRLAGELEERAVRWASDPLLDRPQRAAVVTSFVGSLRRSIQQEPDAVAGDAPRDTPAGPTAQPLPPTQTAHTPGRPGTPDGAGATPDVVLVEDDTALAQMLQFALGQSGFTFRHFSNGVEALEGLLAIRPGARRPLVLLDVDLPGMDGHSLHERLRVERPGAFAVVFLSARGAEAEQLRALRGGAVDYVPKPLSVRVLMAKLPVWIELTNRGREA